MLAVHINTHIKAAIGEVVKRAAALAVRIVLLRQQLCRLIDGQVLGKNPVPDAPVLSLHKLIGVNDDIRASDGGGLGFQMEAHIVADNVGLLGLPAHRIVDLALEVIAVDHQLDRQCAGHGCTGALCSIGRCRHEAAAQQHSQSPCQPASASVKYIHKYLSPCLKPRAILIRFSLLHGFNGIINENGRFIKESPISFIGS